MEKAECERRITSWVWLPVDPCVQRGVHRVLPWLEVTGGGTLAE